LTIFTSLKIDGAAVCEHGHAKAKEIYRFILLYPE
jgi:hypothetical protein